jgi:hypothetical protein
MKKLLLIVSVLLTFTLQSFGQIQFKFPDTRIATDISGTTIERGDQFDVLVHANGNGNTTTRQLLFDLQYDRNVFEIVSINHTGTGGNGGILPQNSNPQLYWTNYPGFAYAGTSTSTNGNTRYQTATYVGGGQAAQAMAILRVTLTWATNSGMPYSSYDRMLVVRLKLKTTSTATTFNPIKLNFVAGWNGNGVYDTTFMDSPLSTEVIFDQNAGKYVTANVDANSNLLSVSNLKVSFRDTLTNQGQTFNVLSDGKVDINQSLLNANTVYDVTVMHEMDKLYAVYNSAITISDFTTAQAEFTSMGLDGSNGQILKSGQSLYAADINRNKLTDGGDLPPLLTQVVGIDTLFTLPAQYTAGSGGWMSLPTWTAADVTTLSGATEWGYVTPGTAYSTLRIDMRKFPQGTLPNTIKSIQLFDLYTGPIEYISEDASWAQYKIPSTLAKTTNGTSTYTPYIRNVNNSNTDYALQVEFAFDVNPNRSWGNINTANWKNITYPRTYFKTGTLGTNAILDLKYLLWGDVNRSHSSQVVESVSSVSTIVTNAKASLINNTAFRTMNATVAAPTSIDVNLSNVTVTSNDVVIPIVLNTNGALLGGLQFEFQYDPTKIKFEELKSEVPNTWYVFANAKSGKIKFGALDQNNKTSIKGINTPFKLKFSTIGSGVDILTSVKVSPTMDASSSNGTQLGINLNTTQIKLTGYNNF